MIYKNRYEFSETKWSSLIEVYDRQEDTWVTDDEWIYDIEEAIKLIESYEDNLNEAAWYRSQQDGYTKGEQNEQQAKNQQFK